MTLAIVAVAVDTLVTNARDIVSGFFSWPRRYAEEWVEDLFVAGGGRALHRVEARFRG